MIKNSNQEFSPKRFAFLDFFDRKKICASTLMIVFLMFISACGGGKKTSSAASGNAILPSAPKLNPPTVTFPPASNYHSNSAALNISGSCTPSVGSKVYLEGDENLVVDCASDGTFSFIVANSSDGTFNYALRAESLTEHPSDATPLIWQRSSVSPSAPSITTPSSQPLISSDNTITLAGTCAAGGTVNLTGDSTQSTSCDGNGNFSFSISKSTDGTYLFSLTQTNDFGNTSPSTSFSWTRLTTTPAAPTIATPSDNPHTSSETSITLSGTCPSGTIVQLNKIVSSVVQYLESTSCVSNSYSFALNETVDGTYVYNLSSINIANIASATVSFQWNKNSALPSTPTLTSPNPSASPFISNSSSLIIAGTCEGDNLVTLSGDSSQTTSCSSDSFSFTVNKSIDATYNFSVYQNNGVNNSGSASVAWLRDTAAPLAPILVLPGASPFTSNSNTLAITGTCEPGAIVSLSGDSSDSTTCSGSGFSFSVSKTADGTYNLSLNETDVAGNSSTTTSLQWIKDSVAPSALTLSSPSSSNYSSNTSTLTIAGSCENNAVVYLSGDSTQNITCSASSFSFSVNKSTDLVYNFSLYQKDSAGNTSTSISQTWKRDTQTPTTPTINSITTPSNTNTITLAGSCETGATVYLTGDSTANMTCSGASYSFDVTKVVDGTYSFSIYQVDAASNASAAANQQWVRDTIAPLALIITSPESFPYSSNGNSLTITGTCEDSATVVYLVGDSTQNTPCSGSSFSFTVNNTSDGVFNFSLYQRDPAGSNSPSITAQWIRDTSAPSAPTVTTPASNPYTSADTNLTIAGNCETGATVALSGSSSGNTTCSASAYSFSVTKNTDSTYNFSLAQTDAAGNSSGSTSFQWVRNTALPPSPTISSPASTPFYGSSTTITLSGDCVTGNTVQLSGANTQSMTCTSNSYSFSLSQSTDGTYNYSIVQINLSNLSSGATNFTWVLDRASPTAPLVATPSTSPVYNSANSLTISGSCETNATVNYSGSATGSTTCSASSFSFTVNKTSDGTYTFSINQTDRAGNSSSSSSVTWVRDTAAPSAPVLSLPATNPYTSKTNSITVSGSCESNATVSYSGSSSGSTTCTSSSFSFIVNRSTDGTANYSIYQTDLAGNTSNNTNLSWTRDTTAPTTPVLSQPNPTTVRSSGNSITVIGSCETNATVNYSGSGTGSTACASSSFTFNISKSTDDIYNFSISQTDAAGNTSGTVIVTWYRDTLAPAAPTLTSPNENPYISGDSSIILSGGCESNATVKLSGSSTQNTTCSALSTYSFTVSNSTDGTYNYSIAQTDQANNTSASLNFQWTRDTTIPFSPVVTSPSSLNYYSNGSTLTISVTCQTGLSPEVAIVHLSGVLASEVTSPAGILDQNCTSSPVTYIIQKSTDGTLNLNFEQENPNNSAVSAASSFTWIRDTISPSSPTITTPSSNPYTGPGNITLAGSCESNATVNITGSSTLSQTCVNSAYSFSISKSSDATYTFNITQTDLAGNTSGTNTLTWNRNSNSLPPPNISSPASNPYASNDSSLVINGTCQPDYTVTLAGDISASDVTSPNNSLTQVCDSSGNFSYTLQKTTDGSYSLALTESFNSATSSATTLVWTRDTQAPSASISTISPDPNLATSITFTFSAPESATFQCKINSTTYQSCSSPTTFTGLTNGSNTFYLIATDTVGNEGSEQTYTWTQSAYSTVALYHMDSLSGTTLSDASLFTSNSIFNNNMTASGTPTLDTNGKLPSSSPKSYKLGTSKYFSLANNNSINSMKDTMTIEAIFNFSSITSTTGQYYTLFSNSGSSGNYGWELRLERSGSCGYVLKFIGSLDGTNQTTVTSTCFSVSASTSRWYYTALTWNKGTVKFYMSRTSATSRGSGVIGTAGTSSLFPSTANLKIGTGSSTGTGSSLWLTGSVDEVRFSNTVRSITSYPSAPFTAD